MVDQQVEVVVAGTQRRQGDRGHADAVVEVAAEPPGGDLVAQVAIGDGDQAHVDMPRLGIAEPVDHAFLQRPQQHRLQVERHFADLVEAERAPVRQLEPAGPSAGGRAGEGAGDMPEQLAGHQLLRHRAAVEGDERAAGLRLAVDGAGQKLLAGAGLAVDQHRHPARGEMASAVDHRRHRLAAADDVVEGVAGSIRLRGLRLRRRGQPAAGGAGPLGDDQHGADGAAVMAHRVEPFRPPARRQPAGPVLDGHPFREPGHFLAHANGGGDRARGVHEPASAVDGDQPGLVGGGQPLQAHLQQAHALARRPLAEQRLDLPGSGDGQGEVVALVRVGRP